MTYFPRFPLIEYDIDKTNNTKLATHIFKRVKFLEKTKQIADLSIDYIVKDSDKPEIIADKIYGSVEYYWIIFLMNEIINPYDWVMNSRELEKFVLKKYGAINGIIHYVDPECDVVVNSDYPGAVPITFLNYENQINESKRTIRLLDPEYLAQVEREFIEKIQ